MGKWTTRGWTLGAQSGSMGSAMEAEVPDRGWREGAPDGDGGREERGEPEGDEEGHGIRVCGMRKRRGG